MAESSGSVTSRRGEANDGPIEGRVDQVEAKNRMKLRNSSLKGSLLGVRLLLLRGDQQPTVGRAQLQREKYSNA
jgi:hypothetical protein